MQNRLRSCCRILGILLFSTKLLLCADFQAGRIVSSTNRIEGGSGFDSVDFTIGYQGPPALRFATVTSRFFLSSNPTQGDPHEIYLGSKVSELDYRVAPSDSVSRTIVLSNTNGVLSVPVKTFAGSYYLTHEIALGSVEFDQPADPVDNDVGDDLWISTNSIKIIANPIMGVQGWHWLNPLPQGNDLHAIAFGHGKYVAVGDAATILVSSDAVTWKPISVGTNIILNAIVYADGRFIVAGSQNPTLSSSRPLVMVSNEGESWSQSFLPDGYYGWSIGNLAFGGGRLIALPQAVGQARPFLWTSTDGSQWRLQWTEAWLASITFGDGLFAGASYSGMVASTDAINWYVTAGLAGGLPAGLSFGAGSFVAVGDHGAVVSSSDGWNWNSEQAPTFNRLSSIVFGGDRFVAVGDYGAILSSTNGRSWTQESSETINDLFAVTYGSNGFVAVGRNGTILQSAGSDSWTQRCSSSVFPLFGAASGSGVRVAVGLAGQIFASTTQTNWVPDSGTHNALLAVSYGNEKFVAVGTTGTLLSSHDGLTWNAQTAPVSQTYPASLLGMVFLSRALMNRSRFN